MWWHTWRHSPITTDYNKTHSRDSTREGIHQSPQTTTKHCCVTAHVKAFTNHHRLQQNPVTWQHTCRHSPVTTDYNKTQSCDSTHEGIHQSPQTTTKHTHIIAHEGIHHSPQTTTKPSHVTAHMKAFTNQHRLQQNPVTWQHTWRHSPLTTDYNKTQSCDSTHEGIHQSP